MKNQFFVLLAILFIFSCKEKQSSRIPVQVQSQSYNLYGNEFDTDSMLSINELYKKIKNTGDTLQLSLKGNIKEVCTKKGCWMTLSMDNDSELMVRFKDYGFFVPLDASGEVLINGEVFISETSVDDLRHYAKDAGASDDEILAITTPKMSYNFVADGVLITQ